MKRCLRVALKLGVIWLISGSLFWILVQVHDRVSSKALRELLELTGSLFICVPLLCTLIIVLPWLVDGFTKLGSWIER